MNHGIGLSLLAVAFMGQSLGPPREGVKSAAFQEDGVPPAVSVVGVGKYTADSKDGPELQVGNVAFKVQFQSGVKEPKAGRVGWYEGQFDGSRIIVSSWEDQRRNQAQTLRFSGRMAFKDDMLQAGSLKIDLNYVDPDKRDAIEASGFAQVSGYLVSDAKSFRYLISKMDAVK